MASSKSKTDFDYVQILTEVCREKKIQTEVTYHQVNSKDGNGFIKTGDKSGKIYPYMTGCSYKLQLDGQWVEVKGHGIGKPDATTGASRRALTSLFVHLYRKNRNLTPAEFGLTKLDFVWHNSRNHNDQLSLSSIAENRFHQEPDQNRKLFSNAPPSNQFKKQSNFSRLPDSPKKKSQENGYKPDEKASSSNWRDSSTRDTSTSGGQHSSPKRHSIWDDRNDRETSNTRRPALGHDPYDSAHDYDPSYSDYSAGDAQSFHSDQTFESYDGGRCHRRSENRPPDSLDHRQRTQSDRLHSQNPSNAANQRDSNGRAAGNEETGGQIKEAIRYLIRNRRRIREIVGQTPHIFEDSMKEFTDALHEFEIVHHQTEVDDENTVHFCRLLYKGVCVYLAFDQKMDGCYRKLFYFLKLQFA